MGGNERYWLYDTYDGEEKYLGRYDTLEQVQEFCRKREEETGGEFEPVLKEWRMVSEVRSGPVYRMNRLCVVYNWSY